MSETRLIQGWFDGAVEPRNPGGHGSYGALIKIDGVEVWSASGYLGEGPQISCNVAEYQGAIACMRQMFLLAREGRRRTTDTRCVLRGDSKLVINQLDRRWRVRGGLYVSSFRTAIKLREKFTQLALIWVPRAENTGADYYSKKVLRERGVAFRLQPE